MALEAFYQFAIYSQAFSLSQVLFLISRQTPVMAICSSHRCSVDEDDTLKFHPSPSEQCQRFSLEAFQYVNKHPYVFFHCKVKICNASDTNSRCAQGCLTRRRRSAKPLPESPDNIYALAQGPFTLNREKREAEADEADQSTRVASKGKNQRRDGVF